MNFIIAFIKLNNGYCILENKVHLNGMHMYNIIMYIYITSVDQIH